MAVQSPAGYTVSPASKSVTVYRAAQQEDTWTAVPIANGNFTQSSADSDWRLPTGWSICLNGKPITAATELDAWSDANKNSDDDKSLLKIQTVELPDGNWGGIRGYGTSAEALRDFSLKQTVTLSAGTYRLSCKMSEAAWGFYLAVEGIDGAAVETGAADNAFEFNVPVQGDYTISFVRRAADYGTYFELRSVSLEKKG